LSLSKDALGQRDPASLIVVKVLGIFQHFDCKR
jgi:hypothetical protein